MREYEERQVVLVFSLTNLSYIRTQGNETICGKASGTATFNGESHLVGESSGGLFVSGQASKGFYLAGAKSAEKAKQPRFEAEGYPAEIVGSQNSASVLTMVLGGGLSPKCNNVRFSGEATGATAALALAAEYEGCTALDFGLTKYTTIKMNSCHYGLNLLNAGPPYAGSVDVICTKEGDGITVTIFNSKTAEVEPLCTFKITSQTGREALSLATVGAASEREVALTLALKGLSYTRTQGNETICGKSSGTATYNGGATLGAF